MRIIIYNYFKIWSYILVIYKKLESYKNKLYLYNIILSIIYKIVK